MTRDRMPLRVLASLPGEGPVAVRALTLLLVTCYFQGVKKLVLLQLHEGFEGSGQLTVSIASISALHFG